MGALSGVLLGSRNRDVAITDSEGGERFEPVREEDVALLDPIVRSAEFLQQMKEGFGCPDVPSDEVYELAARGYSRVVTGCIVTGTPDAVREIHEVLAGY